MANSGTVTVRILGDASSLKSALGESDSHLAKFSDKMQATGSKMMDVGKKMSAAVTLPVVALGAVAFDAASDLNESLSKATVVFGDFSDGVIELGDRAATSLGMSRQAAIEAASTFGNLFRTIGLGKPEAAKMSTSLVELAADLASFNNLDPGEVLEKLKSGLVGEAEPMRSLGVQLTEATVKAKALEMGLGDAHGELTEGEKVQARYALILEQTKTAQGDFARTADGAANKQRILKAQFQDAAATIGQKLMPIGMKLIEWLQKAVDWFSKLSPHMQDMVLIGIAIAAAIGPVVGVIGSLVTAIGFLISPVGLVIAGIAALVAGFIYAYNNFEGFRDLVDNIASWLVETAWPMIQTAFTGIVDAVQTAWDLIQAAWENVGRPILEAYIAYVTFVVDTIQMIWPYIAAAIAHVWDLVSDYWHAVGEPIFNAIITVAQTVIGFISDHWGEITATFEAVWGAISAGWNAVGKPIFDLMIAALEAVIDKIETAVGWFQTLSTFGSNIGGIVEDTVARAKAGAAPSNTQGKRQFALGGYVDAPRGAAVEAIVHGGEYVLTADQVAKVRGGSGGGVSTGGTGNITVIVQGRSTREDGAAVVDALERWAKNNGPLPSVITR